MEKRLLLAFVLSFAVLIGFNVLFPRQTPTPSAAPTPSQTTAPATPETKSPTTAVAPLPADVPKEEVQAANEEVVVVDTELYTAIVSNVGGVLKSFKLKNYTDDKNQPIELINQTMGEK